MPRFTLLFAALLCSCATGHPAPPTGEQASMSLTGSGPAVTVLTGRFSPVSNITSGAAITGASRITGTVKLTSAPGSIDDFAAEIEFTSDRGSEELYWSVVDGRCGSGGMPLVPPHQLRAIEVPSTGHARFTGGFRATLAPQAEYHLDLYAGDGTGLSSVVGCANLGN